MTDVKISNSIQLFLLKLLESVSFSEFIPVRIWGHEWLWARACSLTCHSISFCEVPRPGLESQVPTFFAFLVSFDSNYSACDVYHHLCYDCHELNVISDDYNSTINATAVDPCIQRLDHPEGSSFRTRSRQS